MENDQTPENSTRQRTPTDSYAVINGETKTESFTATEMPVVETVTITRAEYDELMNDRERVNTYKHIQRVEFYLHKFIRGLLKRIQSHDRSKLEEPEAMLFALHGHKLKDLEYGSEEYEASLRVLQPALEHHYANNRHHPEHFKNSIEDMNLLDIVEMFCDWKASSERQNGGNLRKTLEENGRRFEMGPMLVKILENSIDLLTE